MTVRVGEAVWEKLPEGADYETRGGRVFEVAEVYRDDGELDTEFHVVFRFGRRIDFKKIAEKDIDESLVEPLNDVFVRAIVRAMAGDIAKGRGRWNSTDRLMFRAIRNLVEVS